jgi:Domain of unknown function (DUF4115)
VGFFPGTLTSSRTKVRRFHERGVLEMLERAVFGLLCLACLGMLGLAVLAWHGYFVTNTPSSKAGALGEHNAPSEVGGVPPRALAESAPRVAIVSLTAARGACWLSVRRGSSTGERLFLGTLRRGRSIRVKGARIWMRVGAAEKLVVRINGRAVKDFPEGTVDVSVTAERVARV